MASGRRRQHQRRGGVSEDHPRRPDAADLVRELLGADQQDGALHLLQNAGRVNQTVRKPGAGGHQVNRRVRLIHAELTREPGGGRGQQPSIGAGAEHHRADLLGRSVGLEQCVGRGGQRELLQTALGVAAAFDAGLGGDLGGAHRRPARGRVADDVVVRAGQLAPAHCQGLDARLHVELRPDQDRGQRGHGTAGGRGRR